MVGMNVNECLDSSSSANCQDKDGSYIGGSVGVLTLPPLELRPQQPIIVMTIIVSGFPRPQSQGGGGAAEGCSG